MNTIVNRDGRLYGYNTDYAGFSYLAKAHGVDFADKTVLILGTGGTHSTVAAVCWDGGAGGPDGQPHRPGRRTALQRGDAPPRCADHRQHNALRHVSQCGPVPHRPQGVPRLEAVLDVVYNPFRTELCCGPRTAA